MGNPSPYSRHGSSEARGCVHPYEEIRTIFPSFVFQNSAEIVACDGQVGMYTLWWMGCHGGFMQYGWICWVATGPI